MSPPRKCFHPLLRSPFFQRYGVNLPSSLTEGRSFTLGEFSLPTCVGLRYGRIEIWLEAFLGGLGAKDFRTGRPALGIWVIVLETGIFLGLQLPYRCAHPVHSMGSPSLPRPPFTHNDSYPVQD